MTPALPRWMTSSTPTMAFHLFLQRVQELFSFNGITRLSWCLLPWCLLRHHGFSNDKGYAP